MRLFFILLCYSLVLNAHTFVELLDKAKDNDPLYLMAKDSVDVATSKKEFAYAEDNMQLYVKGDGRYYGYANQSLTDRPSSQPDINDETNFWSHLMEFGLKINLYDGKVNVLQEFRELEYKQAVFTLQEAHNALVIRLIERYLNVLRSYYDYEAALSGEVASDSSLDRYSAELNSGKKDIVEFSVAQAKAGLTTVALQIKYDTFINDVYALELLIGEKLQEIKLLKNSLHFKRLTLRYSDEWIEKMKQENLTLLHENLTLQLAQKNVDLAQEKYGLKLTGTIAAEDKYNRRLNLIGKTHEYGAYAGVNIDIPLYTFGRSNAVVKEALSLLQREKHNKQRIENSLSYQTKVLYLHVKSDILQIKASKQKVLTFENLYTLALSKERVGRKTSAKRLKVASELAEARSEYEKYKCNFLLSKYRLKELVGSINEEEFREFEEFFSENLLVLSEIIEEE